MAANEWHTLKIVARGNNAGNPQDFNWAVFITTFRKTTEATCMAWLISLPGAPKVASGSLVGETVASSTPPSTTSFLRGAFQNQAVCSLR